MLQHKKKDYLIRLIEELFKKLFQLLDKDTNVSSEEKHSAIKEIHQFFKETFNVDTYDNTEVIIEKISDADLLEHYVKTIIIEHQISTAQEDDTLHTALEILEYLQNTDSTYSWERTIMREDILRILDKSSKEDFPTL